MREFKSIRIIHNIDNKIEFIFFAEFFRLCGIYVGEYIFDSKKKNEEINLEDANSQDCFDADIFVGLSEVSSGDKEKFMSDTIWLKELWENFVSDTHIKHFSAMQQQPQKELLLAVLNELCETLRQKDILFAKDEFEMLAGYYVDYNLMFHFLNLQYYRFQYTEQEETIQTLTKLKKIFDNENIKGKRSMQYASLYCATKANVASFYQRQEFLYPIEELEQECMWLIENYRDFSNAWVLLGLIYEHDMLYSREAVYAFERALIYEQDHSYASHIYYWIGKRYEAYRSNREDAIENYKKAAEKKTRFRNIYKIATYYVEKNQYESAIMCFEKIILYLQEKLARKYLDPLECEYYYKAHSMIAHCYIKLNSDYEKVILHCERAISFKNDLKNMNSFFCDFYGEKQQIYLKLTLGRMNTKRMYQFLAIACRKEREFEKAQEYMNEANEVGEE